ncbi:uncharacterized protein LOC123006060 [Tribolium madens]|uniref:uncharacterized protein LOC123006060 n=1 Tax=Tribolium madens TaxID=41895 RepID=UPI001CF74441|nr:uncharacterized protein LOC123006060 [Tribolium madens]
MKLLVLVALCYLVFVINAATVPLSEDELNTRLVIRQRRSPFILTALGAAGLVGAGLVGAGVVGLAGAGLVGAGLGAKAGFAAGALTGAAARSYGGAYYYTNYEPKNTNYEYRANLRVRV